MDLHVKFDGHEIIVTRAGNGHDDRLTQSARRAKPSSHPKLARARSPEISEFRAHAFQAAVSKARELGWIV